MAAAAPRQILMTAQAFMKLADSRKLAVGLPWLPMVRLTLAWDSPQLRASDFHAFRELVSQTSNTLGSSLSLQPQTRFPCSMSTTQPGTSACRSSHFISSSHACSR